MPTWPPPPPPPPEQNIAGPLPHSSFASPGYPPGNRFFRFLFVPFAVGTSPPLPPDPLPTNIQWLFEYFGIFKTLFFFEASAKNAGPFFVLFIFGYYASLEYDD